MEHPRERSGLTRRRLLRRAAGSAVGLGAAGFLAGCENTTEPIGPRPAGPTGAAAKLVVPKPIGPGGLPLPRPDNAVTWAITAENRPIPDGRPAEKGPLNLYNYADYLDPAPSRSSRSVFNTCKVSARHLQLRRRGDREARLRRRRLRRDPRPHRVEHRQPHRAAACCSRSTTRTCRTSRRTSGRSSRTRSTTAAAATPCRTSSGWTGSAGGTTRSRRTSPRWTSPGTSSGTPQPYRGKVGLLDDKRDGLSMPMQRDAMHAGVRPGPQHRGPRDRSTRPARTLDRAERHLQHQGDDHRLPDAARGEDVCSTTRGRATSEPAPSTTCRRA